MGARGPKPGFKKRREEAAIAAALAAAPGPIKSAPPAPASAPTPAAPPLPVVSAADLEVDSWSISRPPAIEHKDPEPAPPRSAAFWENPAHLEGDDLRALGHKRGLSRSAMAGMSDDKIRRELTYIAYARSAEASANAESAEA